MIIKGKERIKERIRRKIGGGTSVCVYYVAWWGCSCGVKEVRGKRRGGERKRRTRRGSVKVG